MADQEADRLWRILQVNRDRLQRIADEELRGALLGGSGAADGRHDPERENLIMQADEILDQLEKLYKYPKG